ncbi:MAG: ABC transporter permease [Eubacterium sp.]|nr:ABC transporter permease [Eubacterium sp.]
MENYKELGNRYLKTNKKRSYIIILGCLLVAAVIFAILNCMANWLEKVREDIRAEGDYEILVLTDDKDIIQDIVNESFVRSAYLGKEFSSNYIEVDTEGDEEISEDNEGQEEGSYHVYANALHIRVKNILMLNYYNKYIQETYGVETELNEEILWTYFMDSDGAGYIAILLIIFASYIFSIIGVGIVRNGIQISAMERIKDYGNLRCIGATKKQVKSIIFRETMILETSGIAGGILLGYLISIPYCLSYGYPIKLHILPILLVMLEFYFDMFFAINDGVKKVLSVSPSEAIRGNFKIKTKKIKKRRSGLWRIIFGIEGDYAYKNVMRNKGRAIKSGLALAFGLAAVVVIGNMSYNVYNYLEKEMLTRGYYQQYMKALDGPLDRFKSGDEAKVGLYSAEELKKISKINGIDNPKFIYKSVLYTSEDRLFRKNASEDYLENAVDYYFFSDYTYWDEEAKENWLKDKEAVASFREANPDLDQNTYPWDIQQEYEEEETKIIKDYWKQGKGLIDYDNVSTFIDQKKKEFNSDRVYQGKLLNQSYIDIYGYDEEDYARYNDRLIEGKTDLSENGLLLVNYGNLYVNEYNDEETLLPEKRKFQFTELKVGDQIEVVDPLELNNLIVEEIKKAEEYDNKIDNLSKEWEKENAQKTNENGNPLVNPYESHIPVNNNIILQNYIVNAARMKLIEEGKTKTYVIEGIVDGDPNLSPDYTKATFVVPLDNFYEITGLTSNDYRGFMMHISNIYSNDISKEENWNLLERFSYNYGDSEETYDTDTSYYIMGLASFASMIKYMVIILLIILIIVLVNIFNSMVVTISNLHLRRKEFAQLRAIGMTEKGLAKAVMLEGIIIWPFTIIIGLGGGFLFLYYVYKIAFMYLFGHLYILWPLVIGAVVIELMIMIFTNLLFFKQMKMNLATELTRSGE